MVQPDRLGEVDNEEGISGLENERGSSGRESRVYEGRSLKGLRKLNGRRGRLRQGGVFLARKDGMGWWDYGIEDGVWEDRQGLDDKDGVVVWWRFEACSSE